MIMEKTKLLRVSVIALLLLNFGILFFLFFTESKKESVPTHFGNRREPKAIIIEKLHLDNQQINDYQLLINWHRSQIRSLEDTIRNSKNELYLLLNNEPIDLAKKDSLIDHLSQLQKEIESTHFKHFQDIKKLCTKEQLKDYESLTKELSRIFSKGPKPRHE